MNSDVILALFDSFTDPRKAGQHTRLDYANAQQAVLALQQHFQSLAKPAEPPAEPKPA